MLLHNSHAFWIQLGLDEGLAFVNPSRLLQFVSDALLQEIVVPLQQVVQLSQTTIWLLPPLLRMVALLLLGVLVDGIDVADVKQFFDRHFESNRLRSGLGLRAEKMLLGNPRFRELLFGLRHAFTQSTGFVRVRFLIWNSIFQWVLKLLHGALWLELLNLWRIDSIDVGILFNILLPLHWFCWLLDLAIAIHLLRLQRLLLDQKGRRLPIVCQLLELHYCRTHIVHIVCVIKGPDRWLAPPPRNIAVKTALNLVWAFEVYGGHGCVLLFFWIITS